MNEANETKHIPEYTPLPACVVNERGKVSEVSENIETVFTYSGVVDADIFVLTGIRHADLLDCEKQLSISKNGKVFRILRRKIEESGDLLLYFQDISEYESLKQQYENSRLCIAIVNVDNYDELQNQTSENNVSRFMSEIDKTVRQWAGRSNASVTRYKEGRYEIAMESRYCEKLEEAGFTILDDVRGMESEADFPATLSIGIGVGAKNPAQTAEFAGDALDLALGRGGDQVVVKRPGDIKYFGGKAQTVEKSNKGKSRIVGYALVQLINQADGVFIMGHKNPDMDAFGAALGIYRFAANMGKDAHVVINTYNETLAEVFLQAKESGQYSFINCEKAQELVSEKSVVVVVDTHRPSLCECPELLSATEKIVVIDHHRRAEEYIENPILTYIEPYASSTAELVTEMLQYAGDKKSVQKLEAEALLAGIAVDTNKFSIKTGVRTFDAAAWLRRNGADTTQVKRFFQTDALSFKIKAQGLADAEFVGGAVFSVCGQPHPNIQILNSQVADELLEIKGVKASFVAGSDVNGKTVVSARSLGELNVQVIMEKFGGGGHLTTAGAQVEESPKEIIEKLKELLESEER